MLLNATEYTVRPRGSQLLKALLSSDVFNLYAGALHVSVKAVVDFTDCYPVISDRVCQVVLVCFVTKHSAHCAQVHNVRSAYVNNA